MKLEFVKLQKDEYILFAGRFPVTMLANCIKCGKPKTNKDYKRHICNECNRTITPDDNRRLWDVATRNFPNL
jgi:hypothetical protein